MNSKKNLVFLGMMGSGKSSIGFSVAKKLHLKFIDIDCVIEKEEGMKIADIFKDKGENYFRLLEEKNTLKALNFNNSVISLGGGAFINEKIRKKVLNNNFSFWLNWNTETLLKRIKKNKKRPIAFNSSDIELISLIKKRSKIYSKAQIKVNCNNLTKSEIIKKILKIYELN
mgnify:CR=1 FL=1|jgi:shikimate kinase